MNLSNLKELVQNKKLWLLLIVLSVFLVGLLIKLQTGGEKKSLSTGLESYPNVVLPGYNVVRVEPLPDKKDVSLAPTIKISFGKSIKDKKVSIATSPRIVFDQSLSAGGYRLVLTPKEPLATSTKYTLTILAEKKEIYSWSFTTGNKIVDLQVIESIKKKLPYEGDHFRVSYAQASDRFYVDIDTKPMDTYKQKALDWFTSQGLPDAENAINIVYFAVGEAAD